MSGLNSAAARIMAALVLMSACYLASAARCHRGSIGIVVLYRPVGVRELELIAESGWRAFPPRLPIQPIFYPVLNETYAEQIARGWNTKDRASGYAGFITRFSVRDDLARRYPVQTVGAAIHQELWVPAEELEEFNAAIEGRIEVIASFKGELYSGEIDPETHLPAHLSA